MPGKMFKKIEIVKNRLVLVQSHKDRFSEYPIIWLRDNCQCNECFDPVTKSRKIDWETFNFNKATLGDAKVRLFIVQFFFKK